MKKLMIIDGHNLLFRMYYGIPSPILNKEGKDVRGVLGFISSMNKMVKEYGFEYLMIVFDSETSITNNLSLDGDYKQNRINYADVPDEENPFVQLEYIYKVLTHIGAIYKEAKEYEADDYIASLCRHFKNTCEITIVSTDRDFLQLIDQQVTLYSPRGKHSILYNEEELMNRFGITPSQVIDYKTLIGDSADNIKGIPSIGPKTAVKILSHGTLDEIMTGRTELEEKLYEKLLAHKEILEKNRKLVTLRDDIDIEVEQTDLCISFDTAKNPWAIFKECGLTT
ncbi:MAG: 5'-3' exonuclease [Clostridia bacterium]|nr:5'-3' exonuclease [Clostridia bacterium]